MITYDYEGSCGTESCENYDVMFDVACLDGVPGQISCGACGVNFTDRCVPKVT